VFCVGRAQIAPEPRSPGSSPKPKGGRLTPAHCNVISPRWALDRRHLSSLAVACGRFEATAVNELWVGDGLVGPTIAGRRAVPVAFLDGHSRAFMGYR
jgi:hypothetical protein